MPSAPARVGMPPSALLVSRLTNKAALKEFIRSAAAIHGFRSDLDWDEYSQGLIELATELEQLAAFRNARGLLSKVSVFVDRQTNVPLPTMAEAPRSAVPAPRLDHDGDTVVAAQISVLESRLTSRIAALQGNAPGRAARHRYQVSS
ncbi:hypothetical protein E4U17_006462 [Claviceps sp. LM77 group G4]|nr:hypothetical protein E4U17_006462 [Claviceps sp. LM77 group G4]